MKEEMVIGKIQDVFRDVFVDESLVINRGTNANDIEGWDSLNHIVILESVQDEFSVCFEMDEIIEMRNVGDMIDAIIEKTNEK